MVGPCIFRCQQQEHEVDGSVIDRVEIDGLFHTGKHTVETLQLRQLAMGNSDAAADTGGAQALAFQQGLENPPLIHTDNVGGVTSQYGGDVQNA